MTKPNPPDVQAVRDFIAGAGGYDLQETDLGLVDVEGWDGAPTRLWRYHKVNADGSECCGRAIMLNPDPLQVARWAVNAAVAAGAADSRGLALRAAREMLEQSGFQFLVRGVHWESMDGGPHKAYPFFDGVTVKLKAIPDFPTALTEAQLEDACQAKSADVTWAGRYGRIISTTREEWVDAYGPADLAGLKWPPVVRQAYRQAWGQDNNALITASVIARRADWGF